ncbi:MAG: hypothetical protein ACOYNY_09015 [Caldilineaceae bacterium]
MATDGRPVFQGRSHKSANYQTDYTVFYELDRPDNKTARVIYANAVAASVQPDQPYPYGSVLHN